MDDQYVRGLHIRKKFVGRRLYAAICLLLVAVLLLSSASYAWLVLSSSPEVSAVKTNISANGSLEIALGKDIGRSAVGDSSEKNSVTHANRTWGNLIDLTDASYGLQAITLRPALLNAVGGAVNILHPLSYPIYGEDGRVDRLYANNVFAGVYNGGWFATAPNEYGVRGIGATMYNAPGLDNTFGPLSQRQEVYYEAYDELLNVRWSTDSRYSALCSISLSVLEAYCTNKMGVSASEFDLTVFSEYVNRVVSSGNEELRLNFTLLAASEATSAENYFMAMELLEEEYPRYEAVQSLVSDAIQAMGAADVEASIAELRAFQNAAAQLKAVIDSGEIDASDGYSMEEIEQTVGLIFDLEKSSFSETSREYYSAVVSGLYYKRVYESYYYRDNLYWHWTTDEFEGFSVTDLFSSLEYSSGQDNDGRSTVVTNCINNMYLICSSLPLAGLDQTIADLYVSHWRYWDDHAEEYQSLKDEVTALEAELPSNDAELLDKKAQLQMLLEEKVYAPDDSRLETLRSVLNNSIEVLRQYTLWSIAYFACDGQVPDDGYRRMQEIAASTEYIHPRTAYQILCNYGVTPADELAQMVEAYEKLETELLFLPGVCGSEDAVAWAELETELQRIFGNVTHEFHFIRYYSDYNSSYSPEDSSAPVGVMTRIREEIENYKVASSSFTSGGWTRYWIRYGIYDDIYQPWAQALGLLNSFYNISADVFDTSVGRYALEDWNFAVWHSMQYSEGFHFDISIGVGSEDNFNQSGLTVRQTRFQTAQENLSDYRNRLITAAVNADEEIVTLLMQLIGGQENVSLTVISDYLSALRQQLEYGETIMYHAALAMAASDYANDGIYQYLYSDDAPDDAAGMIEWLRQSGFDEAVMSALDERMALLSSQEALLAQSAALLEDYRDPETGALTVEQVSAAEAVALLDPVLDTSGLTLYGYVEEPTQNGGSNNEAAYTRTVLYTGYGSPTVQISGDQASVSGEEPVTLFGKAYLSLERSLSGSLLAFARSQVQPYTPPTESVSANRIVIYEESHYESRINRNSYTMGTGETAYTLNLHTMNAAYALSTNLWLYTGDTDYISADQPLIDLYGYCVDLSFRTNEADSNLLLQTEGINRIYSDGETQTDTTMGAGSYMEFAVDDSAYTKEQAWEYMACICVAITDTNTGYIYGYAALDMDAAKESDETIKAPLRMYDKSTGLMIEDDTAQQYICHLEQNQEKNLTVYVYLDGAKTTNAFVDEDTEQSMQGVLNLQFCSSADLHPVVIDKLLH